MKKTINLSVVIPVANEAEIIREQLKKIAHCVNNLPQVSSYELVIVENGSSDSTWQILQSEKKKYPLSLFRLTKSSYGSAIITGLLHAKFGICLLMPLDWLDEIFLTSSINKIINQVSVSIIVVDKNHPQSHSNRNVYVEFLSTVWSLLQRITFPSLTVDSHGLKLIRLSASSKKELLKIVTRDEFVEAEWLFKLQQSKKKIISHPVQVFEMRKSQYSLHKKILRVSKDATRLFVAALNNVHQKQSPLLVCDDFGLSRDSSLWMIQFIKNRVVDSISILATHSQSDLIKQLPASYCYSWHLNLTEGRPISSLSQVPSLVDKNGNFFNFPILIFRIMFGLTKPQEISQEIKAQYNFFKNNNILIKHVAGHWHVHLIPVISRLLNHDYPYLQQRSLRSTLNSLIVSPFRWLAFVIFVLPLFYLMDFSYKPVKTKFEYVVHDYV